MGLLDAIRWCGQLYLTLEDQCLHLGSLGGLCQRVPSPASVPAPLLPSLPLSSRQDDEALASSSPLICSEESFMTQGPEPTQELPSDLVPVSISGASTSPSVLLASDGLLSASEQGQCKTTEGAPAERGRDSQGKEGLGGGRTQGVISAEPRGGACRIEEPGGPCFYAAISSPSFPPPALDSRESHPSEQSLDEEPAELQGAKQTQKNQKKDDTLPAFVRDGLDSFEQSPLEEQSDPLRCEEDISGDKKEALLSLEKLEKEVGGLEMGADRGVSLGIESAERGACNFHDLDGFCLDRIMSCLENPSLQACSLVCREWLEASRFARSYLTMQGAPPVTALRKNLKLFPNLRTICLTEFQPTSPKDLPLTTLALYGHRIQCLKIVRCEWLSDTGLTSVLNFCSELRTLVIAGCAGFSGTAFEGVSCGLERLELLSCGGVTNDGLGAAAAACPRLQELSVKTEGEEVFLTAGLERFAQLCPQLQALAVHACRVTDATLRIFAANSHLLADVSFTCEPNITDGGTEALRQNLPRLTRLTLLNNPWVSLIPGNGRLKALSIGAYPRIPDTILRRRITREKGLEKLRIVDCPTMTDATVKQILEECRHLKYLLISSCKLLTSDVLRGHLQNRNSSTGTLEGAARSQDWVV